MKANLLLLIFFSSCSLELIDKQQSNIKLKNNSSKKTTCSKKSNLIILSDHTRSQKSFIETLEEIQKFYKLRFIDQFILWSFHQINSRPDIISPYSIPKFHFSNAGRKTLVTFKNTNQRKYPYLEALNSSLQKYSSKYSLEQLGKIYDQYAPKYFLVNESFSRFLDQNKKSLSINKLYRKRYFRGEDVLRQGERVRAVLISPLIRDFLRSNSSLKNSNMVFSQKKECDFDRAIYVNQKLNIRPTMYKSYHYGIAIGAQGVLGQAFLSDIDFNSKTQFFKGKGSDTYSSSCQNANMWITSSYSRDHGQHLVHLYNYGLQDSKSEKEVNELIQFSRHIVLKNPMRLIFEVDRTSPEQINKLNKLRIPLYSTKDLGHITALTYFNNRHNFIIDSRSSDQLLCK